VATTATAEKNQRCHPDASDKKLNAAPGFIVKTRDRNGITEMVSKGPIISTTILLVNWSRRTRTNPSAIHLWKLLTRKARNTSSI
jgi:hypothetical protein